MSYVVAPIHKLFIDKLPISIKRTAINCDTGEAEI